jgi:hypothetical protein
MGGFRVIPIGTVGLQVVDPGILWIGVFFIVVALVGLLAFTGSLAARRSPEQIVRFQGETRSSVQLGRGWKMPAFCLLLALGSGFAAWAILQPSTLTLDRQKGTYTLDNARALFASPMSGPISDIAYATMETDTGGFRFTIVFQNGQRAGLGAFTDQSGQSEAVAAVNQFLHVQEASHE